MEVLSQRLEATRLGSVLKRHENTEPTKSFPFQKLPNEIKTLIVEACGSGFFTEDISRLLVSRLWYQMAVLVMYSDLVLSNTVFPWAWLPGTHYYRTPDLAAVHEPAFSHVVVDRLKRLTQSCTFDLDSFFRRLNFEPEDSDIYSPVVSKAIFSRGPWPSSAGVNLRISILDATAYIIPALYMPRDLFLNQFRFIMREAWGVHRNYNTWLQTEIQAMLFEVVRESSVVVDAPGLGRRYNCWNERTAHLDSGPEQLLWPYENIVFIEDGPLYEVRRRSLAEHPRFRDCRRCHICPAVCYRLLHTERLYLRLPSLCAQIFHPVWKSEERDLAHELWPEAEEAIDNHYWDFIDKNEPLGYSEPDPDTQIEWEELPKLKELVINMVLPPDQDYHHPRVVHCITGGARLTHLATHRYADLALETMKTEIVEFAKRCPNAERVLLRYNGTWINTALEFNALTGETRELYINMMGDVCGGGSTFDA